jgi:hypothetical protein
MPQRAKLLGVALLLGAALLIGLFAWRYLLQPDGPETLPLLECPGQLDDFVACVRAHMPRPESASSWTGPDAGAAADLAAAARALLRAAQAPADDCAVELPPGLLGRYSVRSLHAGAQRYCALWENRRSAAGTAALGWGTLIVNRSPARRLFFGVPHPLHDLDTADQGVTLLQTLEAAGLVIAGSHRDASPDTQLCLGTAHPVADASHSPSGYFWLARGVLQERSLAAAWFVEWHGMSDPAAGESCFDPVRREPLDVYITEGSPAPLRPTGFAAALLNALRNAQPEWHSAGPGSGLPCDKGGTTNLLGRHLNQPEAAVDHARLCRPDSGPGQAPSGRFVHVEQLRCQGGGPCGNERRRIRTAGQWHDALDQAYAAAAAAGD